MSTAGDRRGPGPERAFCPAIPAEGRVELDATESHHLVRVRRARVGDTVVLFDGRGGSYEARLVVAERASAAADVVGPYPDREPPRALTLAVSLPEGGRADGMVATLAELGVSTLVPLESERTPRGRSELPGRRAKRWQRICLEAAKVNGRSRLLEVAAGLHLSDVFERAPSAVLLDPDPVAEPLVDVLEAAGPLPWLVVGPEGGFTDAEVALAGQAGANRARLGTTAVRIETAATAGAAIALAM